MSSTAFFSINQRFSIHLGPPAVSADTDQSLHLFLAGQGGGRKCDLSRFIEQAVRAHILELSAEQAKAANASLPEEDLTTIIEEAVQWA